MACDMASMRTVSEQICCAAQPDEEWLELISSSGIRWVINLGFEQDGLGCGKEPQLVEALGMRYCYIPVQFDEPKLEDYQAFCSALQQCEDERVLVHCVANKRASCFVALWMEQCHDWSRGQANHLIHSVWQPDPIWQQFLAKVRTTL